MMKAVGRISIAIFASVISIAIIVVIVRSNDDQENRHYERSETLLSVANLSETPLTLFKAGNTLRDTICLGSIEDTFLWLSPGNYFIGAERVGLFYPISLTGYRNGPDDDGVFAVTVRTTPREKPPRLLPSSPDFCFVPSGHFLMGDRLNPREPHYIWLTGYFIASFEVSNAEYNEFFHAADGFENDEHWTENGRQWKTSGRSQASSLLTNRNADSLRFGQPDHPVTWVNWYEATAYCTWLTARIGGGKWLFTLPTEAEWEKAARGPDDFDYALGRTISDNEVGLYNWKKNPSAPVTVVGTNITPSLFAPNRYGLYHLTGNVIEWTTSINLPFNRDHPYQDDERNHKDTPGLHVVRGGSWYSASIANLSNAYRDAFQPEHSSQETGFRIVARHLP